MEPYQSNKVNIHSVIDHTTTDEFDLSAEELRLLCHNYYDEYNALVVFLPDNTTIKTSSYTFPSVTSPGGPLPPPRHKRVFGMTVKELLIERSGPHPNYFVDDRQVYRDVLEPEDDIDFEDDFDIDAILDFHEDNKLDGCDYDEDTGMDMEVETTSIVSSVGSNDYVSYENASNGELDEEVNSYVPMASNIIIQEL